MAGATAAAVGFTVAVAVADFVGVAADVAVAVADAVGCAAGVACATGSAEGILITPTVPLSAGGVIDKTAPSPVTVPAAIKIAFFISTPSHVYLRDF